MPLDISEGKVCGTCPECGWDTYELDQIDYHSEVDIRRYETLYHYYCPKCGWSTEGE